MPASLIAEHEIREVPLSVLKPAAYNPRRMDPAARAALDASLEKWGIVDLIVWNESTGNIVGGHQRYKRLKRGRAKSTRVVVVHLSDVDERALNLTLNSTLIAGEFSAGLQAMLAELQAAAFDAFDTLRLGELLAVNVERIFASDPNAVPAPPYEIPRTQLGDVIELGRHRLICGDAADADAIAALLAGDAVELLLTDPPYGVNYSAKSREAAARTGGKKSHRDIANDDRTDYPAWFQTWLAVIPWSDYAAFYIFMSSQEMHSLRIAIDALGWKWHDMLLWLKNRPVLSRKDYNQVYEPIAFGESAVDAKECAGVAIFGWPERHRFYGSHARTNVLEFDVPTKNDLHPTMKPVALLEQLLRDGSREGGIILDSFAGSGSTLIACERVGRSCRSIELDPLYCDVIVARWEGHTGQQAVRPAKVG